MPYIIVIDLLSETDNIFIFSLLSIYINIQLYFALKRLQFLSYIIENEYQKINYYIAFRAFKSYTDLNTLNTRDIQIQDYTMSLSL